MVKYATLIILVILGYIIGQLFPFDLLKPNYDKSDEINKTEYYKLLVSIISAIITFCAVLVALFKDDLREYWKRPRIKPVEPSQFTIEELDSTTASGTLSAKKYISRIQIENQGNLPSINTEIYLDSLKFIEKGSSIEQPIECFGRALEWNDTNSTSVILPVGAKKVINIITISAPEKFSKPDSQAVQEMSNIHIGGLLINKEQTKGTWYALFIVYSQNHEPISFKIEMEWKGLWKSRLTEFKSQFSISLK